MPADAPLLAVNPVLLSTGRWLVATGFRHTSVDSRLLPPASCLLPVDRPEMKGVANEMAPLVCAESLARSGLAPFAREMGALPVKPAAPFCVSPVILFNKNSLTKINAL